MQNTQKEYSKSNKLTIGGNLMPSINNSKIPFQENIGGTTYFYNNNNNNTNPTVNGEDQLFLNGGLFEPNINHSYGDNQPLLSIDDISSIKAVTDGNDQLTETTKQVIDLLRQTSPNNFLHQTENFPLTPAMTPLLSTTNFGLESSDTLENSLMMFQNSQDFQEKYLQSAVENLSNKFASCELPISLQIETMTPHFNLTNFYSNPPTADFRNYEYPQNIYTESGDGQYSRFFVDPNLRAYLLQKNAQTADKRQQLFSANGIGNHHGNNPYANLVIENRYYNLIPLKSSDVFDFATQKFSANSVVAMTTPKHWSAFSLLRIQNQQITCDQSLAHIRPLPIPKQQLMDNKKTEIFYQATSTNINNNTNNTDLEKELESLKANFFANIKNFNVTNNKINIGNNYYNNNVILSQIAEQLTKCSIYERARLGNFNQIPKSVLSFAQKQLFAAKNNLNSDTFCMVRIPNFSIKNMRIKKSIAKWKSFDNGSAVRLFEVFSTKSFSGSALPSLIFIYGYEPSYVSLNELMQKEIKEYEFAGKKSADSRQNFEINENFIWSLVIQLSGLLRKLYSGDGVYQRDQLFFVGGTICLNAHTVLVDVFDKKIKLNYLGLYECLSTQFDEDQVVASKNRSALKQSEDLRAFGLLILQLMNHIIYIHSLRSSADKYRIHTDNPGCNLVDELKKALMSKLFSQDLKNLILHLIGPLNNETQPNQKSCSLNDIMPFIGSRFYEQLEKEETRSAYIKNQLTLELENGRLFRLLCKLNTILERPEHELDVSWSETGDRYLLKLFRDFVFHTKIPSKKVLAEKMRPISTSRSPDFLGSDNHNNLKNTTNHLLNQTEINRLHEPLTNIPKTADVSYNKNKEIQGQNIPFLDISHIVHQLNMLDCGSQKRVMLSSRDNRNVIIVTYSDLKRCLISSFNELYA